MPALAAGLAAICLVFAQEGVAAYDVWRHSTAYGHCFLVLPIALWLIWERRGVVAACPPRLAFWPAIPAALLALAWAVSDLLGVMEGRQLAAIGFIELLLMALLGWRLWWGLSPGLLYLFFLVPFGAFLTPTLQHVTTLFIVHGLDFLRIPYEADSFRIAIPEGVFYVAEACAGLRFLIASIAFGVLYAVTMFRQPGRRLAFIATACVVPVVANGIRGLGIVVLGHLLGSAEAGAADHILYGWVFFSAVILLLALAGLPFRQDAPPVQPRMANALAATLRAGQAGHAGNSAWPCWAAACLVVLAAGAGPAALLGLEQRSSPRSPLERPAMVAPPGCIAGVWHMVGDGGSQDFACQGGAVRVLAVAVGAGANPAHVLDSARLPALAQLGTDVDTAILSLPGADPSSWMLLTDRDSGRVAAYVLSIDGRPALGSLGDRLRLARNMVHGSHPDSIALVATAPDLPVLQGFLAAQTGLGSIFSGHATRPDGLADGRPNTP